MTTVARVDSGAAVERPMVGIVKFASCDGCQLAFLGLGPALLDLATSYDIVEFAEASSHRRPDGPFDILFVEGSISSAEQLERIVDLRARTKLLVTIGACASSGGIQAMRSWTATEPDAAELISSVYATPEYIDSLAASTPVADHVAVDAELRGCPIDGRQLVELLTSVSMGRRPQLPDEAVCVDCKRSGRVCVMVAGGEPCLGPVIRTGCGSVCPSIGRGCYGCFGPRESAGGRSLATWFGEELGLDRREIAARFAGFTGWDPRLRAIVDEHGGPPGFKPGRPPPDEDGEPR